ncbi:MAG: hypothetical protein EHM32_08595 [Spirochaetales bacterium]|nr:MAG: hypothetical protein EHM32_08595 [Spirochaetales bacterium]
MDMVEKIQGVLDGIDESVANDTGAIFINVIKNEFVLLDGRIGIPRLPVKEIDPGLAAGVLADVARFIPAYLGGRRFITGPVSAAHQHSLQFARRVEGAFLDFVHLFRIDLRYGGGADEFIEKGGTDFYPAYYTDRIYFKSRLVPVRKGAASEADFAPVRLVDSTYTDSDQYFHTYAIFDDTGYREATMELHRRIALDDVFPVSAAFYPFVEFDHFTACLNVPDPTPPEIAAAVKIFEPLFLYVLAKYRPLNGWFPRKEIEAVFPEILISSEGVELGGDARARIAAYFARYSFFRDDELALRGWWRIDIDD